MSAVSVILEALDFPSDLYISNAMPLFDSLLIDLSFLLLDACVLSVLLTV